MNDMILRIEGLTKKYEGITALDNVSLEIKRGEIHALCGENGAGKSTLIKTISGATSPTKGYISFEGKKYHSLLPKDAIELGISSVYQEFSLIPYLSVTENVFLGKELTKGLVLNKDKMDDITRSLCKDLKIDIDVKKRVCDLGVAYQQMVEIIKAVSRNSKFIILDEPTAVLTVNETKIFFDLVKRLKNKNVTIMFITHRIEEVFELCDRVTVLCDGRKVITESTKALNRMKLISHMVGREIKDDYPRPKPALPEVIFKGENLKSRKIENINFTVNKGEIVGFGGLVGAGRTELAQLIFGDEKLLDGKMIYKGKEYTPSSPKQALSQGIGLIPENRKVQGIIEGSSVRFNQTISILDRCMIGITISRKKENMVSDKYIKELRIKTPNKEQLLKHLSGGNQQKVVLSKILACMCDLIIFDEPTRGIDVNAKQELYEIIRQLVEEGKGIIMISSDMTELMGMSNRIYVMSDGKIVDELQREEFSQKHILELASRKL